MEVDGFHTSPPSPGAANRKPQAPDSPVLMGKSLPRRNDMAVEFEPESTDYPAPALCRRPIFQSAYGQVSCLDDTIIGRAHDCWNSFPIADASGKPHSCDGCRRNVMEESRCLKMLEDVNDSNNLFYQTLMFFQDLEDCAKDWIRHSAMQRSDHITTAKKYRKFISETLCFVCEFVQRWSEQDQENIEFITNLVNLMVMMSNQSQIVLLDGLKAIVREDIETSEPGRIKGSPLREWLHAYVDIQCALLRMLPVVSKFTAMRRHLDTIQLLHDNGAEIVDGEFCWKMTKSIFAQLMKLSIEKYVQLQRMSNNDKGQFAQCVLFRTSPFPCSCLQQLAALCLHVAVKTREARAMAQADLNSMESELLTPSLGTYAGGNPLDGAAPAFWRMVLTFLSTVIQDSQKKKLKEDKLMTKGPTFEVFDTVQDALSFCFWWTWHLAHITSFDSDGNYQTDSSTSCSCMSLLSRFLRLSLTSSGGDDKLLASHMLCYQAISSYCRRSSTAPSMVSSADIAHFHLLWAHFSKKLNETKKSDRLGMHRYTLKDDKSLSPGSWIAKCEKYTVYEKTALAGDSQIVHEDPFKIFLFIFGEIVGLGGWNGIKDRFFSRLQPKEIKELSDCGLSRLCLLFLTVTLSDINHDERSVLFDKLIEYVNVTTLLRTDYKKQKTLLNGLFACVGVANRYLLKTKSVAAKCGRTVSVILKLFMESNRNLDQRNSLWKILAFYFRNLSETFQNSRSFDLHQELLIPSVTVWSGLLKANCGEILVVLESLTTIVSSLRSHVQRSSVVAVVGCTAVSNSICNFFVPWLKEVAKSEQNVAEEIVSATVELCFLTLEIGERSSSTSLVIKLSSLIEYFGVAVGVNLKLRSSFLVGFLHQENDKVMDYLNKQSVESNASCLAIIQGSLKCIVSHPIEDDQDRLVRCLCQIDQVKEVLAGAGHDDSPTFEQLLRSLGKRYDESKTFVQRKQQKDQVSCWFRSLADVLQSFSKSLTTIEPESIINTYKTCAAIVKHCCRILYSAGKSGIVTQIFDTLILPRWIYQSREKGIHPPVLRALAHTLHMYFRSLLSLDFKRDTYLQRVLNDIVTVYLTRFPAASKSASHPFRQVLADTSLVPDQTCTLLRLMKDHCRTGPNTDTKVTLVVEILHSWTEQLGRCLDQGEKALILPVVEQSRVNLRTFPAFMQKSDAVLAICNG